MPCSFKLECTLDSEKACDEAGWITFKGAYPGDSVSHKFSTVATWRAEPWLESLGPFWNGGGCINVNKVTWPETHYLYDAKLQTPLVNEDSGQEKSTIGWTDHICYWQGVQVPVGVKMSVFQDFGCKGYEYTSTHPIAATQMPINMRWSCSRSTYMNGAYIGRPSPAVPGRLQALGHECNRRVGTWEWHSLSDADSDDCAGGSFCWVLKRDNNTGLRGVGVCVPEGLQIGPCGNGSPHYGDCPMSRWCETVTDEDWTVCNPAYNGCEMDQQTASVVDAAHAPTMSAAHATQPAENNVATTGPVNPR
eukprot:CAMPEP_0119335760 /NCGR_PEP_ID=MMETSP1333-20130426/90311_1 /TAXON_ID=418940 /ORGANISM="Scyphosphaera apsteinii, Strain RCC1455" /LENGTH=305 /DNA_ID=CAMNT_0007346403 /DNA_START=1 /DNA_END=919 /DNA_ORIENTATION=-